MPGQSLIAVHVAQEPHQVVTGPLTIRHYEEAATRHR